MHFTGLVQRFAWLSAACCILTIAQAQAVSVTLTTPTSVYLSTGGTVTLSVNILYSVQPTAVGGSISIPAGWTLASTGGPDVPNSVPEPGTTSQLDYAYFSFPAGGAQFDVVLNYPTGLEGTQLITSTFQYRSPIQNMTPAAILLAPQPVTAPAIIVHPQPASAPIGGTVVLNAAASGTPEPTYQWLRDGLPVSGENSASLTLDDFQVDDAGCYSAVIANEHGVVTSRSAPVGVISLVKVAGAGNEARADIVHPNGNVYDQVLLTGTSATITADANQITRVSFIDLSDDIVQVEFSGAGTLTLSLESATGPAPPVKYNQPEVSYMKGHASLIITGADETTHVTVFSVGSMTAVNQDLFPLGMAYDGIADIGLVSIASRNGMFGGIRAANAGFFRASGLAGIHAPSVAVRGPVYIGDINADADAMGVLLFGSATDVRITGGDLLQLNNRAVQVDGITRINFTAGTKSDGQMLPAQPNRARLERDGVDVTEFIAPTS